MKAAEIEPENEAPINTADVGKKGANSLQFTGLQGSAGLRDRQKTEEAANLSGIDPNAIYAICMQQPELVHVALAWARLSVEKRARILAIVD